MPSKRRESEAAAGVARVTIPAELAADPRFCGSASITTWKAVTLDFTAADRRVLAIAVSAAEAVEDFHRS